MATEFDRGDGSWDAEAFYGAAKIPPGTRVSIRGNPIGVMFIKRTGVVIRPDDWDGYYIIRLDVPAKFREANGETHPLPEIREAWDNLTLLDRSR